MTELRQKKIGILLIRTRFHFAVMGTAGIILITAGQIVTVSDKNIAKRDAVSTAVLAVADFILTKRSQAVTAFENFIRGETIWCPQTKL